MNIKARRNILRAILCLALVAFGVFLLFEGMYHSIVLDNRGLSRNGVLMAPVEGIRALSGKETVDIPPDERALLSVKGPKPTMVLELDGSGGRAPRRIEYPLRPGLRKMMILSVPALVDGGGDPFLEK